MSTNNNHARTHYSNTKKSRLRRKRQLRKRLILTTFVLLTILVILFIITSLFSKKRISFSSASAPPVTADNRIAKELYATTEIPSPIAYSREEALAKLSEMVDVDARYSDIVNRSEDYPDELLTNLANNPETLDFVAAYPVDTSAVKDAELTSEETKLSCPLFLQWDKRWGYQSYGSNNIAISGCGPTALSMVVVGLTRDKSATPAAVAKYAERHNYYIEGTGTKWSLMTEGAADYGLQSTEVANSEADMKKALDEGKYIIASMTTGDFTTAGHFIVICGYNDEGFIVNDPFCIYRSEKRWTYDVLMSQMIAMWAVGK